MATLTRSRKQTCSNHRAHFYKWGLRLMCLLTFLFAFNLGMNIWSAFDRANIHEVQENLERQIQIHERERQENRKMLDARARIQITILQAAERRKALTPEQILLVNEYWGAAEYDYVQETPFKD